MMRRVAAAVVLVVTSGLLILGAVHRTDSVLAREAGGSERGATMTTLFESTGDGLNGGLGGQKKRSGNANGRDHGTGQGNRDSDSGGLR